jgi:serine/threonine-protein kinase
LEGLLLDGRYRVGPRIGSGGMSVVHEAEDLRLSRKLAIKLLKGESSDEVVERLFREARAAARANHAAVVTVFGYGTDAPTGLHYLAMERLQGEDLAARIAKQGSLPIQLVLRLGIDIADALAAVHATGVVHRDLKPSNVFLARRGVHVDDVKLLDFGVAKQVDLHTLTAPGEVIGTLLYMAPEQLADPKHVDARSDLYALGALLYECLSARAPFEDVNLAELATRILYGDPADVTSFRSDIPPALAAIVHKCLARRARDRYPTALRVRDTLLELRGDR